MRTPLFLFLYFALFLQTSIYAENTLNLSLIAESAEKIPHKSSLLLNDIPLKAHHEQEVILKGFLHRSPEGLWILAQQPKLKSCCVGSAKTCHNQVFLHGNFSEKYLNRVIMVKGTFFIEPEYNEAGQLASLYHLKNAWKVAPKGSRAPIGILALLGVSAIGGAIYIRNKRIHSSN